MFEQPDREQLHREIFWKVQYVFDPEDQTAAFAYTIGLADRGLPELQLAAAPEQDPSDSPWILSSDDCAHQLNRFASMLVDGALAIGEPFSCTYDGGASTVIWTPGDPVPCDDVEAYGADSTAGIIPIRGRLQLPDVVPLADLPAGTIPLWRSEQAAILATVVPNRRGLRGFRAPRADASFECEQEFGPLTPIVEARAHAISQATPIILTDLLLRTLDAESTGVGPRLILGTAHTLAKLVGRHDAAEKAASLALTLVKSFRGPHADEPMWRAIQNTCGMDDVGDMCNGLSGVLVDQLAAILVASTVADQLDDSTRLAAFGPWSSAHTSSSMAPEEAWLAPEHILDTVRMQLDGADWDELDYLIAAWLELRTTPLAARLRGLAVTGQRGCPPASELLAGSFIGVRASFVADVEFYLTEFLCCATALLVERASFNAHDVHAFCDPFWEVLPELEFALNSPIAEQAA
ncbi:hypothetical protein JGU71_19495 [Antrihabitans sp. YC3-6]|uniref:Uncharacterized protein n=1 Tax=Antrihabitans stalagmiti TaxID=2799499 RepID=A0A934NTD5_9NOCA|nr:hypothetical protein [Antrihabitans stalagmiti]MBJ8341076.1 hypothetical protein [Antrihabitans stalagmiti]